MAPLFMYTLIASNPIFGTVTPPSPIARFNAAAGGGLGIIPFASALIRVITLIAGIYALFNIVMAGYGLVTSSGNPKAYEQATQQLFMSLIGLAVIVGSFGIAAIIGFLLFGDAMYILSPTIPSNLNL